MYVVIFKSQKQFPYSEEYAETFSKLQSEVKKIEGFQKFENWINDEGLSIQRPVVITPDRFNHS